MKSKVTPFYKARYGKLVDGLFFDKLPDTINIDCVILEGMFMINTAPLGSFTTFANYRDFLLRRWVKTYFEKGVKKVQILFDDSLQDRISPKAIEHLRRKSHQNSNANDFTEIQPYTKLPGRGQWRTFLEDRSKKRGLCDFLCRYMISNATEYIRNDKSLIVAGGFQGANKNEAFIRDVFILYPI